MIKLRTTLKGIISVITIIVLGLTFVLAIFATLMRTDMAKTWAEAYLTRMTGHQTQVASLQFAWSHGEPSLVAHHIRMMPNHASALAVEVPKLALTPDMKASMHAHRLQLSRLSIEGLVLHIKSISKLLSAGVDTPKAERSGPLSWAFHWVLDQPEVMLRDAVLIADLAPGRHASVRVPSFRIAHQQTGHHLSAHFGLFQQKNSQRSSNTLSGEGGLTLDAHWQTLDHVRAALVVNLKHMVLSGVSRTLSLNRVNTRIQAQLKKGELVAKFVDFAAEFQQINAAVHDLEMHLKMGAKQGGLWVTKGRVRRTQDAGLRLNSLRGGLSWHQQGDAWAIEDAKLKAEAPEGLWRLEARCTLNAHLHPLSWNLDVSAENFLIQDLVNDFPENQAEQFGKWQAMVRAGELRKLHLTLRKPKPDALLTFKLTARPHHVKLCWAQDGPQLNILESQVEVNFGAADDLRLRIKQADLAGGDRLSRISQIEGVVGLHGSQPFAEHLHGQWQGYPIEIDINQPSKQAQWPDILLHGVIPVKAYQPWLPASLLSALSGASRAQLRLHTDPDNQLHANFESDLKGVTSRLPTPLNKGQSAQLSLRFAWRVEPALAGMQIRIGSLLGCYKPAGTSAAQLSLTGFAKAVDLDAWMSRLSQDSSRNASNIHWKWDVDVEHIKVLNQRYANVKLSGGAQPSVARLIFDGSQIAGQMIAKRSDSGQRAVEMHFRRLFWPIDQLDARSSRTAWKMNELPETLKFECDQCALNLTAEPFTVHAALSRFGETVDLTQCVLTQVNHTLSLKGKWQQAGIREQTRIDGHLSGNDIGAALASWKLMKGLEGGGGDVRVQLVWPGAPNQVSLKTLEGQIGFQLANGRIVNIDQHAEAKLKQVRALNNFSPSKILHHMATSFKDLTESGYHFDRLRAQMRIRNHILMIHSLQAKGPAVDMEIAGGVNLIEKSYDLVMRVIPHVTASLPVVATLAGGVVLGAATWLADHVMSARVDEQLSQAFRISGSWDQPNIKAVPERPKEHEQHV